MKWRCPVQHKPVKDTERWTQIARTEGPFHRDYRQMAGQSALNFRAQLWIQHRFSPTNTTASVRQRTVRHRAQPLQRPATEIANDKPNVNERIPPAGTRKLAETKSIPLRVLWLRFNNVDRPRTTGLRNRFGTEGMDIHVADLQYTMDQIIDGQTPNLFPTVFDLIMLESVEIIEEAMLRQLSSIREVSQAPLIVLTDNYTLDWSLRALREGADAIFTLNTPDDVIVARSNALLRRWA